MKRRSESVRHLDREIFRLALPALATLISEPLLLLADSAIVGHLGTDQLAGLAIAANLLGILTGLCIFLAYGTTGTVARRLGAGDHEGAMAGGFDGLALALILGIALSALLELFLVPVVGAYGASPTVTEAALAYLRIAALGLPSILILLAGTGVLRGLQDTKTPLYVVIAANVINIGLNFALVYGAGLGIAGSALGTLIAQTAAAAVLVAVIWTRARRARASWRFRPAGRAHRGPVRFVAGAADSGLADRHHAHHVRGGGGRGGHAGRPSGGEQPVDPAGVRPGCDRHRRPGDHRPGAGRRRRGTRSGDDHTG